jgi:hypothetical protein
MQDPLQVTTHATRRRRRARTYFTREALLTRGELAFFWSLRRAIAARCLIMCKVRLADAVTCSERAWRSGGGNAIAQKHLDFVLCDSHSTRLLLAIELDDRSHSQPHRRRRDRFVERALDEAGIRLVRFRASSRYCPDEVRARLDTALSDRM